MREGEGGEEEEEVESCWMRAEISAARPKDGSQLSTKAIRASSKARSQNICPFHLIRADAVRTARKNFFAKRRMRAVDEIPRWREQVCLSKIGGNLLCRIVHGSWPLPFFWQRLLCRAQDAASSALSKPEAESEEIVVSATRIPMPEDESPASVTVIRAKDFEIKQTRRVADALRQVPGLSIAQRDAGPAHVVIHPRAGQRSNAGFAGWHSDQPGSRRFVQLRRSHHGQYRPDRGGAWSAKHAVWASGFAGVVQIFTKQGSGPPTGQFSAEAGPFSTFREIFSSSGDRAVRLLRWPEPARYRERPAEQSISPEQRNREHWLVAQRAITNQQSVYLFARGRRKPELDSDSPTI